MVWPTIKGCMAFASLHLTDAAFARQRTRGFRSERAAPPHHSSQTITPESSATRKVSRNGVRGDRAATPRTTEAISSRNIEPVSDVLPAADWRHSMVASEFEYRHRFWMIVLVYVAAYAFYNINHLNILYAVVPWNQGVLPKDTLVRFLYAAAALLAAAGAILLTWSTAYRPSSTIKDHTAFSIAGPYRFVRNPQYLSYFFLILA